jgi:SAM-dependent methyltransferase
VLDLGCGTGMAAVRIAAAGFEVTGADPSLSMLAVARCRQGTERVRWVHAAGQTLDLAQRFALIYMTGHAFQALLTDEDAVAVLRNAGRHLAPGGRLAFDTRNPAVREWLTWNAREWREVRQIPELGLVEESGRSGPRPGDGRRHHRPCLSLPGSWEGAARAVAHPLHRPAPSCPADREGPAGRRTSTAGGTAQPFGPESQEIIAVMGKPA